MARLNIPKSRASGKALPCDRNADLAPVVAELRAAGVTSQRGIAAVLNERGIPTPAGSGLWHGMQVGRLLKRLAR
jgi:hypothetical protein